MNVKLEQISKNLTEAIKSTTEKGTEPYDSPAKVVRLDGETVWVHISGGVDETPVKKTIDCKVGDTVQIRVSGGTAFITGNITSPPTDDSEAKKVSKKVETVVKGVESLEKIAGNTNQYFWHTERGTDTGAHITEIPREEFLRDPENGGGNLLARSNGIAIRDGLTEMASFSANGSQIGLSDDCHALVQPNGFELIDYDGDHYVDFQDWREFSQVEIQISFHASGQYSDFDTYWKIVSISSVTVEGTEVGFSVIGDTIVHLDVTPSENDMVRITGEFIAPNTTMTDYFTGDGTTTEFHFTIPSAGINYDVYVDDVPTEYTHSPISSRGAVIFPTAPANGSTIKVIYKTIDQRAKDYTLGLRGEGKIGAQSYVIGSGCVASTYNALAEGRDTLASGQASHAEGRWTEATGLASHTEGEHTEAQGSYSHATGYYTIAQGANQTVIGKYNIPDGTWENLPSESAFIVGNGAWYGRSNAFSVNWGGDIYPSGNIYLPNAKSMQMKDSGGTYRNAVTYNSSNQFTFGNGSYTSSTGGSYFDGNSVNLRYKTNLTFNNNTFQNMFTVTTASYTQASTSAGANNGGTVTATNSGWTPLGIVGWTASGGTNPSNANVYRCYLSARSSGSATVTIRSSNSGTSAMAPVFTIYILWVRNT